MGNLSLIEIQTRTIRVPSGSTTVDVTVYGLGLGEIIFLARGFGPALQEIYAKAAEGDLDEATASEILLSLIESSDGLAAQIIALGCGEPDMVPKARRLPIGTQIELLEAISGLTFAAEGGPKKLMEIVKRAIAGMKELVPDPAPLLV